MPPFVGGIHLYLGGGGQEQELYRAANHYESGSEHFIPLLPSYHNHCAMQDQLIISE